MTQYTLGTLDKATKSIGILANGVEVERVTLSAASDRIKALRAEAAAPLFTGGAMASKYRRQNVSR